MTNSESRNPIPAALITGPYGFTVDPELGLVIGLRGRPIGSADSSGYLQIDGRSRGLGMLSAHLLIWEAVNGPVPDGFEVNHINGHKQDNRITNLELLTHQGNILHAYANGLKSNAGEKHPSHKLTAQQVIEIRRAHYHPGSMPARELAAAYGVSRKCISDVVCGRTWKSVGPNPR